MFARRRALGCLGAAVVLAAPVATLGGTTSAGAAHGSAGSKAPATCAPASVATWTVRQLANQVVAVPIQAGNLGSLAPMVRAGYGGILLFGAKAPSTLGATAARLRRLVPANEAPLVMTDEEGGGVVRLDNLVGPFPWARVMARSMTPAQITAVARRVGSQLRAAGVNVDLAPVLDVDGRDVEPGASDPDGYRSFGGRPSIVTTDGEAFLVGLREARVLAVVKHFPGLGGSTGNTDYGPAATMPWPDLKRAGLHPFEAAIRDGVPAVMVANAHVPGLTASPATVSAEVLTGALRTWLKFKGLIVTDSLTAGAISAAHLSVPAASVAAIGAGADLILLGAQPSPAADAALAIQASNAIVAAVHHGVIAQSTLAAAAAHVLAAKATLGC